MKKNRYVTRKSFQSLELFKQQTPQLSRLDIELTERCNSACRHCYINLPHNDAQASQRELSTDQWKAILKQAVDLGALSVRFTGGEPLLRDDFADIYLYARRLGMKVILFTNARLITPELADLFVRVPPLMKIEISVYGMSEKTYDHVACSPGAYQEYRRGMKLLLDRNIPVHVKYVLLSANRSELGEFETWAASFPGMSPVFPAPSLLDLRARRDIPKKNELIKKMRFSTDQVVDLESRRGDLNSQEMANFSSGFLRPRGDQLFTCGAGETVCVDAFGKLQMCLMLRHPDTVYDMSEGTLQDAITNFFPGKRELTSSDPEYLNKCACCFLKGLCEQCPAKSWAEHGTLDTPVDYFCQVAHAQARHLGLLKEGENAWDVSNWQERIQELAAVVDKGG